MLINLLNLQYNIQIFRSQPDNSISEANNHKNLEDNLQDLKENIDTIKNMFEEKFSCILEKLIKEKYINPFEQFIKEFETVIKNIDTNKSDIELEKGISNKINSEKKRFGENISKIYRNEVRNFYQEYQSKITYRLLEIFLNYFEYIKKEEKNTNSCDNCNTGFRLFYYHLLLSAKKKVIEILSSYETSLESEYHLSVEYIKSFILNLKTATKSIDLNKMLVEEIEIEEKYNLPEKDKIPDMSSFFSKFDTYNNKKGAYKSFILKSESPLIDNFDYKKTNISKVNLFDPRFDSERIFDSQLQWNPDMTDQFFKIIGNAANKDSSIVYFKYFKAQHINLFYMKFFDGMICLFFPVTKTEENKKSL